MKLVCVMGTPGDALPLVARAGEVLGAAVLADPDGPLGALHERLLEALGGTWVEPPALESGWEQDARLDPLRAEATALADHHGAASAPLVLADHRLGLLLPFWRTVGEVHGVVHAVDDPITAARSLARHDALTLDEGVRLWLRATAQAQQADTTALIVCAEDGAEPSTVASLCALLGIGAPDAEQLEAIAALGPDAGGAGVGAADSPSLAVARDLYALLRRGDPSLLKVALQGVRHHLDLLAEQDATQQQLEVRAREAALLKDVQRQAIADLRAANQRLRLEQLQRQRAQDELARVRGRRSVRMSLRAAEAARPLIQGWRRLRTRVRGGTAEPSRATPQRAPHRPATREQQAALAERIRAQLPDAHLEQTPPVSIVMLNRSGAHHLRTCLPALAETRYPELELIVVDNASTDDSLDVLGSFDAPFDVQVISNDENRSFSEANNQGAAAARGELVLLLNNDIEPVDPSWLAHMVRALQEHDAVAVGARLVYPARPGLDEQGEIVHPDLTLQHRGLTFDLGDGVPRARNLGGGEDPLAPAAALTLAVPGVTAACMLVRREALDAVGGLTAGYVYGTEDVDLCLKLRQAGGTILYAADAVLWHHEYGTQTAEGAERKRENRLLNRELFVDRWGPQLFREVLRDKITGAGAWSEEPLRVAITLTNADVSAGWGDWYTAHELGDALEAIGWQVTYIERYRERWYDLDPGIDVVIVLLDLFEIWNIPSHVVKVAWVRNWTERWLSHPWFDDYDVVFASSSVSKELIDSRSSHVAQLLPIATNPERFAPQEHDGALAADVLFVGNYWQKPRMLLDALPPLKDRVTVKLFGAGWEDVPALRDVHQGTLPYDDLPAAYSSARIVLDDTAGPTKPYAAVNTRVFDALAAGALVVSDNPVGIRELFDDDFPCFQSPEELAGLVEQLLADPQGAQVLADRYRAQVLERHTYAHRARQIRDALTRWNDAVRVGVHIGVPDRAEAPQWGDTHFARAVQRQLARAGHPTRVVLLPEWHTPVSARPDVLLHLLGLSELWPRSSQVSALWLISHPEKLERSRCDTYDAVFVASESLASELARQVAVPVHALRQATDPEVFRPGGDGPRHELLFVGNSRGVRRRILDDLLPTDHDLAIYGSGWTKDLVDLRQVRGDHIPNDQLATYYASAAIVLNDHWPDMRSAGIYSNRLYDVLAAGGFVISDHIDGIEEEFDGGVVTYTDAEDLRRKVDHYLAAPDERAALAARGRAAVLARHTFEHRVRALLDALGPLLDDHPRGVLGSDGAALGLLPGRAPDERLAPLEGEELGHWT